QARRMSARAKEDRMLRRWSLPAAVMAAIAVAWFGAGCAPKSEETKVTVSDSTVQSTTTVKESTAVDTSKAPTGDPAKLGTLPVKPKIAPAHVQVEHVLIGFSGTIPGS